MMNAHAKSLRDPWEYRKYWIEGALAAGLVGFIGLFFVYIVMQSRNVGFVPFGIMFFFMAGFMLWAYKLDEEKYFEMPSLDARVERRTVERNIPLSELIATLEKSANQQREFARQRERQALKPPEEIYVINEVLGEGEKIVACMEERPVKNADNEELIE